MNRSQDAHRRQKPLPLALTQRLEAMIRRIRFMILARGGLTTLACGLLCVLAIMAVDAVFPVDSVRGRWALFLTGLTVVLVTAWRTMARPLLRRLTPVRMARILERRHPDLDERISSALELLSAEDDAEFRGSRQLIALLGEEAGNDMRQVSPKREFTTRTLKPWWLTVGVAVTILIVALVFWPRQVGLLLVRAVAPYSEAGNLPSANLRVTPGHATVLSGARFRVALTVPDPDYRPHAWLSIERPNGTESVERMRRITEEAVSDGEHFELVFPRVAESFSYRVRFGAALSRLYHVETLPEPAVQDMSLTFQYPAYTGFEPETVAGVRDIVAVQGTKVTIAATFNRPVRATLLTGEWALPAKALASEGEWDVMLTETNTARWALRLEDRHGFTNTLQWARIEAAPDRPPRISLDDPAATRLTLSPQARLPVRYRVQDDFGVDKVELWLAREPDAFERVRTLALPSDGEADIRAGGDVIDASRLDLRGARKIWIRLKAYDRLPSDQSGPQIGESRVLEIEFDDKAASLMRQRLEEQTRAVRAAVEGAAERLDTAAATLEKEQDDLDKHTPLSLEQQRKLDEARHDAAVAEAMLKALREATPSTPYRDLSPKLEAVLSDEVTPALQAVDAVAMAEADQRIDQARTTVDQLRQAAEQTRRLADAIDALEDKAQAAAALDAMADRQRFLADRAQESDPDAAVADEWRADQAQLAEETADWAKQREAKAVEALRQTQETAKGLADEARAWSEQQDALRDTASQLSDPAAAEAAAQRLEALRAEWTPEVKAADSPQAQAQALQAHAAQQAQAMNDRAEALNNTMAEMPQTVAQPMAQQAAQAAQAAAEQAGQAAATPEPGQAAPAQKQAGQRMEQAADSLSEVAEALGRQAAAIETMRQTQEAASGLADEARAWSEQQDALRDTASQLSDPAAAEAAAQRLEALRAKWTPEVKAADSPQAQAQALQAHAAQQAQAMSDQAEALNNTMAGMPPTVAQPMAQQAAQTAQAAAEQAGQAAATPEPGQAAPAQKQAGQGMAQAAESLAGVAEALGRQAAALEQPFAGVPAAVASMQTAESAETAAASAAAAEQAAQQLQALAQQAAQEAGMEPGSEPGDESGLAQGVAPGEGGGDTVDAWVGPLGPMDLHGDPMADDAWIRLRGQVEAGLVEDTLQGVTPEYRDLVRRYFIELSRRQNKERNP